MILNQTDIYKILDLDFKRISINVVKKKKRTINDSNIFQENITTEWREIKKSIHNKKIEVSKEIGIMEKLQTE